MDNPNNSTCTDPDILTYLGPRARHVREVRAMLKGGYVVTVDGAMPEGVIEFLAVYQDGYPDRTHKFYPHDLKK